MHKVKILDIYPRTEGIDDKNKIKRKFIKEIKICDSLFEIGLRKGLIEKNDDGYYFIGDYEELIAFKNIKPFESFEWLE